jgi:RNA polymerase sigma-70 factor (ECF subfamily)
VVQNVLLSIHRARHTYRPERPFGPWLWTIARNASTDALRTRSLRLRREQSMDRLVGSAEPRVEIEPSLPLSPVLRRALAELPPNQRQAVELLHLQQFSVAEAAARAGVTRGALKVRAHRGYKALRVALKDEDLL